MALSVGRTRFTLIGAIAVIAALTLIGAALTGGRGAWAAAAGPITPAYVRINVSEKTSVYLEFQGSDVRAAMSVEALKTATPVKMRQTPSNNEVQDAEITLPIPADQLPPGITVVKARFTLYPVVEKDNKTGALTNFSLITVRMSTCEMAIWRTDQQKAQWQYVVQSIWQPRYWPDKADTIQLPSLDKLTLSVTGKPLQGSLGVGVRLLAEKTELTEVRKNGKPVAMQVSVLDASGKEVASKKGLLADFGFS